MKLAKAGTASKKGASQSVTRTSDRFSAWQAHHSTCAIESLVRLLQTPLQSILTWLVIAVATALPAILFVALQNIQSLGYAWQDSGKISVFMQKSASTREIKTLQQTLSARPDIAYVTFIDPEAALTEFKTHSGLDNILDDLEENPLPAVLLVQPTQVATTSDELEALLKTLQNFSITDDAKLDMAWLKRLQQLMRLAQNITLFLALLLTLGLLVVISNTIRLAIENRRDEIVIVKLVGGTNAFVRRPFLYTGFWYGLGGGLIALLLLSLGLWWLTEPVATLAALYQSDFRLQGLSAITSIQLVMAAGFIGLLGAWLAVGRHLLQIEPR